MLFKKFRPRGFSPFGLNFLCLFCSTSYLCGSKSIFQKHGYSHRSDTAGNRRNVRRLRLDLGEINVSAQLTVLSAIDSHIDNNRTLFDHFGVKEIRLSDGGNENIRTPIEFCCHTPTIAVPSFLFEFYFTASTIAVQSSRESPASLYTEYV